MSLARAFTTRRTKKVNEISSPVPQRSNTTKHAFAPGTIRNKISGPVELLSTTNMLSYNAPDIFPSSKNTFVPSAPPSSPPSLTHSSSSSARSVSSNSETSVSTPPTSPEVDVRPVSPNHLSCYFNQTSSDNEDVSAPKIPQRSPSHTKRTHEIIHRKRSISRMSQNASHSVKSSITSFTRDSMQMFSPTPEVSEDGRVSHISHPSVSSIKTPAPLQSSNMHSKKLSHSQGNHPFGAELAQVTELAEEYSGVRIMDEEESELLSKGFLKWDVRDYLAEIEGLYGNAFGEDQQQEWF